MSKSELASLGSWLGTVFELPVEFEINMANIRDLIKDQISDMIENDLPKLYNLLYRIDVDEEDLKIKLKDSALSDSAELITDMIIERQLKKLQSRKDHS